MSLDSDAHRLVKALEASPSGAPAPHLQTRLGLTEAALKRTVGYARSTGLAPIVYVRSVIHGADVYRIANSDEEIRDAIASHDEAIDRLEAARHGLARMMGGARQGQDSLGLEP